MPTLSKRDNYMRMMRGEIPEYVPSMMDAGRPGGGFFDMMGPDELKAGFGDPEAMECVDMFGVELVRVVEANNAPMPRPGFVLIEDITKWRDIIKRPEWLDEIDWQYCADRDLANWDPQYNKSVQSTLGGQAYFQQLVHWMGNEGCMVALHEEPEEVKDLLNFILDMNLTIRKNVIHYYKPETGSQADDIAHERAPFISTPMFEDIFEPIWRADIAPYVEAGIPTSHHNCGMFEPFVPHIVAMGYNAWNPAETMNDLVGIKQKYGTKLAICGGFDGNGRVAEPDCTEEEVRAYVKQQLDTLAPGGGYAFGGGIMGPPGSEWVAERMGWINDEFEKLRYSYY